MDSCGIVLKTVRLGFKHLKKDGVVFSESESFDRTVEKVKEGTVIGLGAGAAAGFAIAGPPGAAVGGAVGLLAGAEIDDRSVHEYVLFEYGKVLKAGYNGFMFRMYLRLDFTIHGYEMHWDMTDNYWVNFSDEKISYDGHLGEVNLAKRTILDLIIVIESQNSNYSIFTNNCKDFARNIKNCMLLNSN